MGSLSSQGPRLDCRSEPKEQVQLLSAIYEKHKKRCSTIIIDHVFTDDRIVEAIEKDAPSGGKTIEERCQHWTLEELLSKYRTKDWRDDLVTDLRLLLT